MSASRPDVDRQARSAVPVDALAASAADLLGRLRARAPRVHCITNTVVTAFTANALLAIGAVPSMTTDPAEIGAFVGSADGLLVNLGTCDDERRRAIRIAVAAANAAARPWVLDPVMVERAPPRLALARDLLAERPAIVRANATEVATLGGGHPDPTAALLGLGARVVACTGARDRVDAASRTVELAAGHPLMARVTGVGCVASALATAFAAVADDPFLAAVTALTCLGLAGESGGARAGGPGSFEPALLDALHALDPSDLERELPRVVDAARATSRGGR